MAPWIENNPAAFFPVVGAAYIPEHRSGNTDQGNGWTRHKSGLLGRLLRDFDANADVTVSVDPLSFC